MTNKIDSIKAVVKRFGCYKMPVQKLVNICMYAQQQYNPIV